MFTETTVIIGPDPKVEVTVLPVQFAVGTHVAVRTGFVLCDTGGLAVIPTACRSHAVLIASRVVFPIGGDIVIGKARPGTQSLCDGRQVLLECCVCKEGTGVRFTISTSLS